MKSVVLTVQKLLRPLIQPVKSPPQPQPLLFPPVLLAAQPIHRLRHQPELTTAKTLITVVGTTKVSGTVRLISLILYAPAAETVLVKLGVVVLNDAKIA